ncbi:membrane protein [Salmonella enterica subsp. enterica]|uniref:Membrane protein n=1 Tax=Salmonella enterica I TaxID=59201 RepID=A0A447U1P3_SALET|nr:membrane protein [Salmonella enterica subsp. enterica]
MLTFVWITLRFIHFASVMLVYGCALYGAWLAPASIRRLMTRRFLHLQQHAAAWSVISAAFMLAVQGGLMGGGWPDVFFRLGVGARYCKPALARSGYGKLSSRWSRWRW